MSEALERSAAFMFADAAPDSASPSSAAPGSPSQGLGAPGVERVPRWERFSWLRAGFSTRQGGSSTVYSKGASSPLSEQAGEQNLGWTVEDDRQRVAVDRERFAAAVTGGSTSELVTIRQFHSGAISTIEGDHGALRLPDGTSVLRGDGLVTNVPALLLGVLTADCVPVLVADTRVRAVAAFHAGWRGTAERIVEQGVATMRRRYGSRPEDLVAAIGPAIGVCCFAVREDVQSEFQSRFPYASLLFARVGGSEHGAPVHLDLHEANRRQLLASGLLPEAVQISGECTACTRLEDGRRKYFSYRAEQGVTGRMLSVIGVVV